MDNDSHDGSADGLEQRFPGVRVSASPPQPRLCRGQQPRRGRGGRRATGWPCSTPTPSPSRAGWRASPARPSAPRLQLLREPARLGRRPRPPRRHRRPVQPQRAGLAARPRPAGGPGARHGRRRCSPRARRPPSTAARLSSKWAASTRATSASSRTWTWPSGCGWPATAASTCPMPWSTTWAPPPRAGAATSRCTTATATCVWTYVKDMPWPLLLAYLPEHLLINLVCAGLVLRCADAEAPIFRAKRDALQALPRVWRAAPARPGRGEGQPLGAAAVVRAAVAAPRPPPSLRETSRC